MQRLFVATRNRHKTRELAEMLGSAFVLEDLTAHPDVPEIEENGATFQENAVLKAVAASRWLGPGVLVLADDSGLAVDALGGEPGVYSARYAGPKAADAENTALLLLRLQNVPAEQRTARFHCVIAIAEAGEVKATFEGRCEGTILTAPRGEGGFGYDPVFQPQGSTLSFAELAPEAKNAISHRARALESALAWLKQKV